MINLDQYNPKIIQKKHFLQISREKVDTNQNPIFYLIFGVFSLCCSIFGIWIFSFIPEIQLPVYIWVGILMIFFPFGIGSVVLFYYGITLKSKRKYLDWLKILLYSDKIVVINNQGTEVDFPIKKIRTYFLQINKYKTQTPKNKPKIYLGRPKMEICRLCLNLPLHARIWFKF